MKESVRKVLKIIMAIGFLIGLAILVYPLFSNMWNEYNDSLRFENYQIETMEKMSDESLVDEWDKAYAYNAQLQPIIIPDSFIQAGAMSEQDKTYMSCLNVDEDGMMGYISIPKIGENIPIYHTATEEILQKGAGHVQGASLPVGGESTHAAISAHRGLPGASLFTDIDQLELGDQFYLYVLDDILAYEVDQILTVKPEETDALNVEEGEDYVTLITCTPYGVNSHRLLVRGHRVPYEEEKEAMQAEQTVHSVHTNYGFWIATGLLAAGVCMLFSWIIVRCISNKNRQKHMMLFIGLLLILFVEKESDVYAAEKIDLTNCCSIIFQIPKAYQTELYAETISVRLYHIADITEDGAYKDIPGYEELQLSELSGAVSAEMLEEKAQETAEFLKVGRWEEVPETMPDKECEITNNSGMQSEMKAGLYLVCVESVKVGRNTYDALPYIISLPGCVEIDNHARNSVQEWNYTVTVDLKLRCLAEEPMPIVEVPETMSAEETETYIQVEYKTGDETKLMLLQGCVIFTGASFGLLCFVEKRNGETDKKNG